jgi:antitoxin HicB
MMDFNYPATIVPDTNGQWLVTFRDVPEAITSGSSKEDALARAPDALETAMEFYVDAGKDLPKPSAGHKGDYAVWPSVLAHLKLAVYQGMRNKGVSKAELARRLGWHAPQVDRLLDLQHATRTDNVEAAIEALGLRLDVSVTEQA